MAPLHRYHRVCDKQFVVGETYMLENIEQRSSVSHKHYFARLNDLWHSLPEHIAPLYPSVEHLRAYALIQAGFCDVRTMTFQSKRIAEKVVAFVKPSDPFSIVDHRGATVMVFSPKSQSTHAMDKEEFGRSKRAVLEIIENMVGVTKDDAA